MAEPEDGVFWLAERRAQQGTQEGDAQGRWHGVPCSAGRAVGAGRTWDGHWEKSGNRLGDPPGDGGVRYFKLGEKFVVNRKPELQEDQSRS